MNIGSNYKGGVYLGNVNGMHLVVERQDLLGKFTWEYANKNFTLPSPAELKLIYKYRDLIGGFQENCYWSSTEYDSNNSWIQRFSDGAQSIYYKNNAFFVRCVKRFKTIGVNYLNKESSL